MFVVDLDTPGSGGARAGYSHTYADTHGIVEFDDVRVPAAR